METNRDQYSGDRTANCTGKFNFTTSKPQNSIKQQYYNIIFYVSQIGNDCLYATIFTHLPKYMKEVLGFSPHETGLYTSMSSLTMWMSSIALGIFCDYLIGRRYLKIVHARKLFAGICEYHIDDRNSATNAVNSLLLQYIFDLI